MAKAKTNEESTQSPLDNLLTVINKQLGQGTVRKLSDNSVIAMDRLSTGTVSLDINSGGGWPWGRIIEIYGPESSGKTTLTLEAIAQAQAQGKTCAFIDAEHALDLVYARNLGVKVDDLIISQPDTGEQALEVVDLLVKSGIVDLIVVDSVAALVPKAEIEGEMGQSHVGLQARLMSQGLRKLAGPAMKNNVLLFFINQIRMKIGVMFGSPETTSGGNALKFYASIRCDIRRIGKEADKSGEVVKNVTRVKFVKNKTAAPFKQSEFTIEFGKGVDKEVDLLRCAVKYNVVEKAGAWFKYQGNNIGQGENNAANFVASEPELRKEIYDKVMEIGLGTVTVESDEEDLNVEAGIED